MQTGFYLLQGTLSSWVGDIWMVIIFPNTSNSDYSTSHLSLQQGLQMII